MSDVAWCRHAVRRVGDLLGGYAMFSQEFARHSADARLVWVDRAGADFYDRYMQSHQADLFAARDRVADQCRELLSTTDRMSDGDEAERALFQAAEATASALSLAETEMSSAHRQTDAAIQVTSACRARADEAAAILSGL